MRLTAAISAMVAVLPLISPAGASASPPAAPSSQAGPQGPITVTSARDAPAIDSTVQGRDSSAVDAPEPASSPVRGSGRRVAAFYATVAVLATEPGGARCLRWARRSFPDAASAAAAEFDVRGFIWRALDGFPPCQGSDTPPPEAAAPLLAANDFWRVTARDLLPRPAPRIAPGYMLAGKLAYLEAGTQAGARFEHPTPIGTLVIEATSRLMVDWGDGSGLTGPHVGPGGPWPNGTITHFWTTAAAYDIRVVQQWSGRWSLGEASGTLTGLETEAVLDDFQVSQLQAVRNR